MIRELFMFGLLAAYTTIGYVAGVRDGARRARSRREAMRRHPANQHKDALPGGNRP